MKDITFFHVGLMSADIEDVVNASATTLKYRIGITKLEAKKTKKGEKGTKKMAKKTQPGKDSQKKSKSGKKKKAKQKDGKKAKKETKDKKAGDKKK